MSRTDRTAGRRASSHEGRELPDVLVGGHEREPRRLTAAALVAVALAAAGVCTLRGDAGAAPPAGAVRGLHTALQAPAVRPRSTDLATVVTVGHVRLPGLGIDDQISRVSEALQGAALGASYGYQPAPAQAGLPLGVSVQFDRRLTSSAATVFLSALSGLAGASIDLGDAPGTTVDVAVPAAGVTCLPDAFFPTAVVLAQPDLALVARTFRIFSLGVVDGAVTVSYTGVSLTREDLRAVGAALAHSCGTSPSEVSLLRREGED